MTCLAIRVRLARSVTHTTGTVPVCRLTAVRPGVPIATITAAPRDQCAAARWRQPWRTKLQNFIYFVALVTAGTSPIRKGHGIEQRPTRIAGCSPLRTCRWKRLRRYRSDCEEVAHPRRRYEYEAVFQAQAELETGMLAIDFEIEKEGMTIPYSPLFNDIRRNHGFVDLRGRPDLAIEIPEGSQSPALKAILNLAPIAQLVAGGYVQLMCASYSDRSPEDYTTFGYAIAQVLGEKVQDCNWFVRFVLKLVVLSLDDFSGAAPSLWIWFYAIAETPEAALASRESLIGELHDALVDEHFTSFFEEERDDGERTYP